MNLIIVIHKMSSDTPISWNDPSNADNPQADNGYIPNDTTKGDTSFYYSDHLGSTSYIKDGHATSHNMMLPAYGELLVDEHIITLIVLSEVIKVVQINNAIDVSQGILSAALLAVAV